MVTAGEMIVFEPAGGGGHVTTCVSGSGSTAMLVDNVDICERQRPGAESGQ